MAECNIFSQLGIFECKHSYTQYDIYIQFIYDVYLYTDDTYITGCHLTFTEGVYVHSDIDVIILQNMFLTQLLTQ